MNIRHICNHCLVITKMALWQLKHLGTCCMSCTKTRWQRSVICVYSGVILETEDRIWQSSNVINNYCFIAI